jgi:hypothetical protein
MPGRVADRFIRGFSRRRKLTQQQAARAMRLIRVNPTARLSIVLAGFATLALVGCAGVSSTAPPPSALTPSPLASTSATAPPTVPPPTSPPSPALPSGCIDPPPDLATIVALDPPTRLACFGGSALTFAATISKPISDCGVGPRVEPAWFCLPGVFLDVPDAALDSGLGALDVYWNPSSGLKPASFVAGTTVEIGGHFDDPSASTCHVTEVPAGQSPEPPDQVVMDCRETFIVTAVH